MPIHYIEGDLISNENNAQAYAIAVNIEGLMNLQSTVAFKNKYPRMYLEYQEACQSDPPRLTLGDVLPYQDARDGMWVFSVAVYVDRYLKMGDEAVITRAYQQMREAVEQTGVTSIAMPPIGGDVGYLRWPHAQSALEAAFGDWEGDIYIYVKPAPREPRDLEKWMPDENADLDTPIVVPAKARPARPSRSPRSGDGESERGDRRRRRGGKGRPSGSGKDRPARPSSDATRPASGAPRPDRPERNPDRAERPEGTPSGGSAPKPASASKNKRRRRGRGGKGNNRGNPANRNKPDNANSSGNAGGGDS